MEVQYTLTTLDSLMLLPNHYCWIGTLRISVYVKVEEIKTLITICECQHACFKMHALKTTCVCVDVHVKCPFKVNPGSCIDAKAEMKWKQCW